MQKLADAPLCPCLRWEACPMLSPATMRGQLAAAWHLSKTRNSSTGQLLAFIEARTVSRSARSLAASSPSARAPLAPCCAIGVLAHAHRWRSWVSGIYAAANISAISRPNCSQPCGRIDRLIGATRKRHPCDRRLLYQPSGKALSDRSR